MLKNIRFYFQANKEIDVTARANSQFKAACSLTGGGRAPTRPDSPTGEQALADGMSFFF